jgi:hypothetical protein
LHSKRLNFVKVECPFAEVDSEEELPFDSSWVGNGGKAADGKVATFAAIAHLFEATALQE